MLGSIRILTSGEVAALGVGNEDVNAFGGAGSVRVEAPGPAISVAAYAGRRGSLVISELFVAHPLLPSGSW